ncbi:hypothetical protein BH10PSE2_BH10PSE2_25250 [soil metagenome]
MDADLFVSRWLKSPARELRDGPGFIIQLCAVLGVPTPNDDGPGDNDYAFERPVIGLNEDGVHSAMRVDLYRADCFVMEMKGARPRVRSDSQTLAARETRSMERARRQAQAYALALDRPPPFLILANLGRSFEVWSRFGVHDRDYAPFPDAETCRIPFEDLAKPEIRRRLAAIWTNPRSLDPTRRVQKVTERVAGAITGLAPAIGERLAREAAARTASGRIDPVHRQACVSRAAAFLSQCVLAMFADSVGLFADRAFRSLLQRHRHEPARFHDYAVALFAVMRKGGYSIVIHQQVPAFETDLLDRNESIVLSLGEMARLVEAADYDWSDVDPPVFGALMEQAVAPTERAVVGLYYTGMALAQRLVGPTILDVLEFDWLACETAAQDLLERGEATAARQLIGEFHHRLVRTKVLDPACGCGVFLFVAMRGLQALEARVLATLLDLPDNKGLRAASGRRVSRTQFLGLDSEPRAVSIARMVMTIGDMGARNRTAVRDRSRPAPVVWFDQNAIRCRDALLTPGLQAGLDYVSNGRAEATPWPDADFIVGNPPYLGARQARALLGEDYVSDLCVVTEGRFRSADLATRWWDRAARILARPESRLRRFGFVMTRSITQPQSRRVLDKHLDGPVPMRLAFAAVDLPWSDAGGDRAEREGPAVQVVMTVAERGAPEPTGRLLTFTGSGPDAVWTEARGIIGSDLRLRDDRQDTRALVANAGLAGRGIQPMGAGFLITAEQAASLSGTVSARPAPIRPYRNGRDIAERPRGLYAVDLTGLSERQAREAYPGLFEHLLATVKPEREANRRAAYRAAWWLFGEGRAQLRASLAGLGRYIVTSEIAKHRWFQFLDGSILPDNRLVCIASDDPAMLAILSSGVHCAWALARGGRLEDRPIYSKGNCFDRFPFPVLTPAARRELAGLGDDLDRHRRRVLDEHPDLTMTEIYNLRERLMTVGLRPDEHALATRAGVHTVDYLHKAIDRRVLEAYGWPADVEGPDLVDRVAALNAARAAEEDGGLVRFLRPAFQDRRGAAASGAASVAAA